MTAAEGEAEAEMVAWGMEGLELVATGLAGSAGTVTVAGEADVARLVVAAGADVGAS